MINVLANVQPEAHELATLAREHLDELTTYATHLVGSTDDAMEFVAGGIHHASRYPPTRLSADGRAALFRAVTRAIKHGQRYPPRPHGVPDQGADVQQACPRGGAVGPRCAWSDADRGSALVDPAPRSPS